MTGGGQSEITDRDVRVYLYCQTADTDKTTKSTFIVRPKTQTRLQSLPLLSDRRQDYKVYLCPETAVTDKTTKSTVIVRPQTRLQSLPVSWDSCYRQDYKVYLYYQTADKYKVYPCAETAVTDKPTKSTFIIRPKKRLKVYLYHVTADTDECDSRRIQN